MKKGPFFACVIFVLIQPSLLIVPDFQDISKMLNDWSDQLGAQLWSDSEVISRRNGVIKSFENATVTNENGTLIHKEVVDNLSNMMHNKVEAVKNIVVNAEMLAKNRKHDIETNSSYNYYNTDNINVTDSVNEDFIRDLSQVITQWKCEHANFGRKEHDKHRCSSIKFLDRDPGYYYSLEMEYDNHFKTEVNTNFSAVRVSPSVYWRERELLNDVRWSEALDLTFKKNFQNDPTLTWQYFGSAKGFMRLYPAMQWPDEKYDKTYDFRIRSWFTEAITCPKDVVILLDKSGSMKGTRRFMSRYIINDILDTLYDNDFINIYLFDNATTPLVDCFGDTLVQANEENLRLLREKLGGYSTKFAADMGLALERAFKLLHSYKKKTIEGANCNQIILVITEGVDYDFRPQLFKQYNSDRHIRVFTYQIGTELSDEAILEWIACANMGYYVNMTRVAEAHEKVLRYLEVMSRPINMQKDHLPSRPTPVWSALYVDLADRRLTNWLWEKYEGNKQRDIYLRYAQELAKNKSIHLHWHGWHYANQDRHPYEQYLNKRKHTFLTTVSMPVYDNRTDRTDLLGVAAVDVSREFIKSLIANYRIGVNGYAFIVTNNGYLILHPDHRTEFEDIIKPTFNRVDMVEVELMDDDTEPRIFNTSTIVHLRELILNHTWGTKHLKVRSHIDEMKRVILSQRHYFFGPLGPFSLVIALPAKYGFWNVLHRDEDNLYRKLNMGKLNKTTNLWSLHPEWHYCKVYGKKEGHDSAENELIHFLERMIDYEIPEKFCDIRLVRSFLADYYVTEWFYNKADEWKADREVERILTKSRVAIVFMATHSGLTRWQDIRNPISPNNPRHFGNKHIRAIDEVWYQRAADANFDDNETFIYSVPFASNSSHDQDNGDILVTVSNVIFIHASENRKAPAAAVGYQFRQTKLDDMFYNCNSKEKFHLAKDCEKCGRNLLLCYILDNNGFIIVSNNDEKNVGFFFGDVRPDILQMMVTDNVYQRINFYDYQAICLKDPVKESPGSRHFSILSHLFEVYNWVLSTIFYFFGSAVGLTDSRKEIINQTEQFERLMLKKQVPTPCDQHRYLYTFPTNTPNKAHFSVPQGPWYYAADRIPRTNLMILVINAVNPVDQTKMKRYTPDPHEINYDEILPCYIATKNNFTRRKYLSCIESHPEERMLNKDKTFCGGQGSVEMDYTEYVNQEL